MVPEALPERFRAKIRVDPFLGCWLWLGADSGNGYGKISVKGRMRMAHRYAYEVMVGPIPEGLVLDHLCRTRGCCNPAHLQPVTVRENTLRGEARLFGVPT